MDNQNNTNWPNNPPSSPPLDGAPPPLPPTPVDPSFPAPAEPNSINPTPSSLTPEPTVPLDPISTAPSPLTSAPTESNSFFNPPSPIPADSAQSVPDYSSPISTFLSTPASPDQPILNTADSSSPLDNPWNAPAQPPPFDGSVQNAAPTWMPPNNPTPPSSSGMAAPMEAAANIAGTESFSAGMESKQVGGESAPTDLSHLLGNNSSDNPAQPQPAAPETLVMPSSNPNAAPEVPNIPTENHKSIPKWLIGVGIGLLIIVAGASAYFILGIGQSSKGTESVPAQITKQTVKTPPPIPQPASQPSIPAAATGSANFGELDGTQQTAATSAGDLLRRGR